jgi:hypothetical protein
MVVEQKVFARPSAYREYGFETQSTVPVLSRNDYNNVNFPDISAQYGRNAVRLMAHSARRYCSAIWRAYRTYCRPSSRYLHLAENGMKMGYHERLYSDVLEGAAIMSALTGEYVTFLVFLIPGALVLYLVGSLRSGTAGRRSLSDAVRDDPVMAWCFVLVLYTAVAGSLFEIGENMRFKFLVEQPMWLFIAVAIARVWKRRPGKSRRAPRPARRIDAPAVR